MPNIMPIPLSNAFLRCAAEIVHTYDHEVGARRLKKFLRNNSNELFVELSPGSRKLDNWICYGWGQEYSLDLRRKMPFDDDSVSRIYSKHVLEHLTPEELERLLKECFRILKNDGIFEAALPNGKWWIAKYIKGVYDSSFSCPSDQLNKEIHEGGQHHIFFDEDNITIYLKDAGFSQVEFRKYVLSIDFQNSNDPSIDLQNTDLYDPYDPKVGECSTFYVSTRK